MIELNDRNYAEFKKQFWDWFDTLTLAEKMKFWYYGMDMAELNFYNRVYSKRN
jgi:hypothetical protein